MNEMLQAGAIAPEIDLVDLSGRRRRPLSPEDGGSGPVLLVFFKDDCPTCRYAVPFVARIHDALGPLGARIRGVAQDDAARTEAFARQMGARFPILLDHDGYTASRAYGVTTVPSLFLVGEDGVVRRSVAGFRKTDILEFARALAERAGAAAPAVFAAGEAVLDSKPG